MSKFGYLVKEGFKSVFTHGFMSFASITITIACLIIMGSFSLLSINLDNMIQKLENENEMIVFIDESLTEDEARALQPSIESIPNVSSVRFVTREEAMNEFEQEYDNPSLFEDIGSDTFRDRYVVYLDDISLMQETQDNMYLIDGVAKVNAHLEISHGLVTLRNVVSAVSLILVIILVVVSAFIIANTIKLTTFGRREEIAIMKMVGATNAFIRLPFIIEGLVLGLLGAIFAFFIQWGIYSLVGEKIMAGIAGNIVEFLPFSVVLVPVLAVFSAIGILIGCFGGVIAIRNYLKV